MVKPTYRTLFQAQQQQKSIFRTIMLYAGEVYVGVNVPNPIQIVSKSHKTKFLNLIHFELKLHESTHKES